MIVGRPEQFAIECEVTSRQEHFIYGRLRFWLGGCPIGSFSEEVLTINTGWLSDSLYLLGQRQDAEVHSMARGELLERVWSAVYGGGGYDADLCNRFAGYIWLVYEQGFERTRLLRVDMPSGQRVIWQNDGDADVSEVLLPAGMYESVARSFLSWFEKETGFVHSEPSQIQRQRQLAAKEERKREAVFNRQRKYDRKNKQRGSAKSNGANTDAR